jgi:hypothetical protein
MVVGEVLVRKPRRAHESLLLLGRLFLFRLIWGVGAEDLEPGFQNINFQGAHVHDRRVVRVSGKFFPNKVAVPSPNTLSWMRAL